MNIKEYFNSTQAKSLATVDENGQPNLCLCGTAFMPDEKTIEIGNVCIDKTYDNIRLNKKATFMAARSTDPAYWKHYQETNEKLFSAGYRLYCTFTNESSDKSTVQRVQNKLEAVVGSRIARKIKSVMVFQIEAVKEINF